MTPEQRFRYADERFADLQMLRYQVRGFEHLSLRQKKLIYFLAEAALTGRDILWDQNGRYNLRIRRLLEAVYTDYPGDRTTPDFLAFETYLKRVWFSNGIHHHYSCDKFRPAFSPDFLRNALKVIHYNGEETALCTENHSQRPVDAALSADPATPSQRPVDGGTSAVDALCDELFPIIFDPAVLPKRVNQAFGQDLVQTSAANYYAPDITQKEAEAFYQQMKDAAPDPAHPVMFGMNSRLVKEQGLLREDVWRNRGLYGMAIERIIYWLQQASTVAENQRQADVINKLIEFYRTGDLLTFDEYTILWVQETEGLVDFVNGFTESYGDPLGMKASWEGFANFKDNEATARTERLAARTQAVVLPVRIDKIRIAKHSSIREAEIGAKPVELIFRRRIFRKASVLAATPAAHHGDAVGEPLFLRKPEEIALKRKRTVDAEDRERAGRAGEDIRPDRQCVGTLQPAEDEQMRRAPARLRLIARQIADSAVDARVVLKEDGGRRCLALRRAYAQSMLALPHHAVAHRNALPRDTILLAIRRNRRAKRLPDAATRHCTLSHVAAEDDALSYIRNVAVADCDAAGVRATNRRGRRVPKAKPVEQHVVTTPRVNDVLCEKQLDVAHPRRRILPALRDDRPFLGVVVKRHLVDDVRLGVDFSPDVLLRHAVLNLSDVGHETADFGVQKRRKFRDGLPEPEATVVVRAFPVSRVGRGDALG